MGSFFSQSFRIPSPPLTETNCPDQSGRVWMITGGYGGVGFELSKIVYAHNATVYIAGRDESKARNAISKIRNDAPDSKGKLEFLQLDLSDLASVTAGAKKFLAEAELLHILVNNAAVMLVPSGSKDKQGNDLHFGTNCLGPVLLYRHLRPLLERAAASSSKGSVRVLWAGSMGIDVASPSPGGLLWDDEKNQPKTVEPMTDYAQTKVGNLFIAKELAKKDSVSGFLHACFNPGNLRTDLQRHWTGIVAWITDKVLLYPAVNGAYTELWAALDPDLAGRGSDAAYVVPWGRISGFRADVQQAIDQGAADRFVQWCYKHTDAFI